MADPTSPDIHKNPIAAGMQGDGLSALERAAKIGLGPMSDLGDRVWHGESKPCVSCGELVQLTAESCSYCGQDLSVTMLIRMQQHSGPWYVLEHVRPFPGVSMERLIRQASRNIVTPTTIVRGPHTDHQWRYAAQTPELCKHVGTCWNCQGVASESDTYCHQCAVNLDRPLGEISESAPVSKSSTELDQLSVALKEAGGHAVDSGRPARRIPAWAVICTFLFIATVSLLLVINSRENADPSNKTSSHDSQPAAATSEEPSDYLP
ncbi:MAG: hypothetical protein GXP29_04750 [Planctomycetes bacterium]|nr:hypothetical protein [Planctomycetota bacterium]